MGAPEKIAGFIPKEQVGEVANWQFQPLGANVRSKAAAAATQTPAAQMLTERERRAFEQGRERGRQEGLALAAKQRADHAGDVHAALEALRARFADLESQGADLLLDLALDLAHKLTLREIAVQRDAVLPVLREAIAQVIDKHAHPRVHLNPQDHEQLRLELDADGLFRGCRFIPDAAIARGGCRVETPHGDVDARLATRWRRVLETLGIEPDAAGGGA